MTAKMTRFGTGGAGANRQRRPSIRYRVSESKNRGTSRCRLHSGDELFADIAKSLLSRREVGIPPTYMDVGGALLDIQGHGRRALLDKQTPQRADVGIVAEAADLLVTRVLD